MKLYFKHVISTPNNQTFLLCYPYIAGDMNKSISCCALVDNPQCFSDINIEKCKIKESTYFSFITLLMY